MVRVVLESNPYFYSIDPITYKIVGCMWAVTFFYALIVPEPECLGFFGYIVGELKESLSEPFKSPLNTKSQSTWK